MIRNGVPREFVWTAPVWQADLDAFGELHSAVLLRLLQETATRASTAAGFDAAYYERTGTMWIIRRTTLAREAAVRYGDMLTVRTWITDFRRVRSLRAYEVRAGDRLVARASTDWVFVDREHARPRRIPDEWERTFMPEGGATLERDPFPESTPPPHATTWRRRVELHELDGLRHVNNSNYVSYLEQAAYDLAGIAGWDLTAQIAARGRLRPEYHDLEYLDSAVYGDELAVTTWPTAATDAYVELHAHLDRGDARRPSLHARSRYRWTSFDGEAPMPTDLRAAFGAP